MKPRHIFSIISSPLVLLFVLSAGTFAASHYLASVPVQVTYVDDNDTFRLAGTDGGSGVYSWDGHDFVEDGQGLGVQHVLGIAYRSQERAIFVGTWGGGVYRRPLGEGSWERLSEGLVGGYDYIRAMRQCPDGTLYAADPDLYIYRLDPGVDRWEQLPSAGLPETSLASLFCENGSLYAGLIGAGVYEYDSAQSVWRTKGGSQQWTGWAIDLGPDGELWAATNAGVYRWTGDSWSLVLGSHGWNAFALKRNPHVPSEVIVGTADGRVYRYAGESFDPEPLSLGIPEGTRVWSIAFGAGEPQPLLVGTGQGLYTTELTHPTPTPTPTATPTARPNEAMTIGMWHSLVPGTEELAYTISYGNRYPEVVDSVVITNMVPLTVTLVSDSYGNGNCGDATWDVVGGRTKLTWVCGEVAPGDGGSVGYRVQLPAGMLTQEPDLAARRPPDPQETPTPPPAIVNDGAHIGWTLGKETYYQKTARDVFPPDPVLLPVVKVMY